MKTSLRNRTISLWAALGLLALASSGCKSQDPAVLLTITGVFRVPEDVDTLRVDVFSANAGQDGGSDLVSHTFTLQAGSNFPYTVTVVDDGGAHSSIKLVVTALLSGSNRPVGTGSAQVQLESGSTVNATVELALQ